MFHFLVDTLLECGRAHVLKQPVKPRLAERFSNHDVGKLLCRTTMTTNLKLLLQARSSPSIC